MRTLRISVAFVVAAAASVGTASAQFSQWDVDRYEQMYGRPIDVTLETLVMMPESYKDKAVRTTGKLDLVPMRSDLWALSEHIAARVLIRPAQEVANRFAADAQRFYGQEMEVTGLVSLGQDPQRRTTVPVIMFWAYLEPEEPDRSRPASPETTLEELLRRPGQRDGERVRVVGQFRGANLFGDLPSASRRRSGDWVIKNDIFAAWVTGKKPEGKGWKLDAKLRRDTGKWILVDGRVRTVNGVVYLLADSVDLTTAPSPTATAVDVAPPPPPPLEPPVVVFSLPLDGERDIPPDTIFLVQFSNDMDDASFENRVGLRYAGRPRPGDRALDAVRTLYDMGRRTLAVDPGDQLRPGRVVELILLPGIVDVDGQPLETRPGRNPGGAAEILRFRVAGTFLSGP
jgi:hypothetical protein